MGGAFLAGRTVVLIGGGSGIGLRVAHHAVAAGSRVVLGGRTEDRLARAADEGGGGDAVRLRTVDVTAGESLAAFFAEVDRVDHLFTTAATYRVGPLKELSAADAESPFTSKFWGQYHAVRHAAPKLSEDASVVLMSGAAGARRPVPASAYAACNAAIEGLGRGLAIELAPVRVNVVSPGTVDGHLWAGRPAADRDAASPSTSGTPSCIAPARRTRSRMPSCICSRTGTPPDRLSVRMADTRSAVG
ncbi:SDR family NAD(P)-dependent oxidoreductase [Streptomyces sp. NPDC002755]